jgi:methionyl-tRNA formyltransferase
MGTPDFAVFSLKALCENGYTPMAVLCQPDKPKGRGNKLQPPPVKAFALEKGIAVYQPATLRDDAFDALLRELDPEVIVVVAYGKILPGNVLEYPKYGCVNVHGSLLPKYRGAAPMQRAIMDGESVTGITTMLMNEGLDTGDMLLTRELPLLESYNFEDVHDGLAAMGAELLLETLDGLRDGTVTPTPQPGEGATYAAKIEKSELLCDFSMTAREMHNKIRGLSPVPLAYTVNATGQRIKLVATEIVCEDGENAEYGKVLSLSDKGNGSIVVSCGRGSIAITSLVPEGKGRMSAAEFIRGRKISVGDVLGKI